MQRFSYHVFLLLILWQIFSPAFADATAIIKAAIDYWRDKSSYSVAEMTIHRSDWQRTMTMWTQG
ncbi:hypothetical protein PN36_17680 [Candidatus Thiomargarita nelsonii]|uniref:Secreted protein n=1 Tax=Candidatus Thiomargarita nelsonii TaxID=1003181 RepID=A0A0A6PDS0_9GAMM|nr:hypothetical protein PN36_17680 [Candidatus Thiomargarita nelsonii]